MVPNNNSHPGSLVKAVLSAGFLVGTLDITAAFLLNYSRGGSPIRLLQFIATGVFGSDAFSGGWLSATYGLLFHYGIALVWTIVFFLVAERQAVVRRYRVASGFLFGIAVWLVMNLVVLPLSDTPPRPFSWSSAMIGAGILVLAIGLPLAFLSARFFSRSKRLTGRIS